MINKKKLTVEKAKKNFKWYRKYLPLIGVLCWAVMAITEYLIGTYYKGTNMLTNDFLIYSVLKLVVIIPITYLIKWKYDFIAGIWEDKDKD